SSSERQAYQSGKLPGDWGLEKGPSSAYSQPLIRQTSADRISLRMSQKGRCSDRSNPTDSKGDLYCFFLSHNLNLLGQILGKQRSCTGRSQNSLMISGVFQPTRE